MGVSVRQKDNHWYVFIRYRGARGAQKCVDQQHAQDTQKAVLTAIAADQFDLAELKAARAPAAPKEEEPSSPTLREFFEQAMTPLWEGSLARASFARYETSFRNHLLPALGETPIHDLTRDCIKSFVV